MRAIIIDDKDAKALLERLELTRFQHNRPSGQLLKLLEEYGVPSDRIHWATDEIHRWFHYVVTSWLQEQGANTVRL